MSIFNRPQVSTDEGIVSSENAKRIYDYLRENWGRSETTCFTEHGDEWGISMKHITETITEVERIRDLACASVKSETPPADQASAVALVSSDLFDAEYISKIVTDVCIKGGNIDSENTWNDFVAQ